MSTQKSNGSPDVAAQAQRDADDHSRLDALMDRIHLLTVAQAVPPKRPSEVLAEPIAPTSIVAGGEWMPIEPETLLTLLGSR